VNLGSLTLQTGIRLKRRFRSAQTFTVEPELQKLKLGSVLTLTQSFDELRPPANLTLRVTFDVIYPSVPASPRVLRIRFCDLSVIDDSH